MATYIIVFLVIEGLLAAIIVLANKCGSKAEKLEALKREIRKKAEEQELAKKIIDNVSNLSADDARRRLHEVANKQR